MDDVEGVTQPWRPPEKRPIAVWLGNAAPVRSIRWLDGALALASKFGAATAIAAGDVTWLDLASDRASRASLACVGVVTDLKLDYLGWAQIAAAAIRHLGASTILVDEASRPERFPEVAAIADLLDAAQLSHVVSLVPDGKVIHASRVAGGELQTLRVRGPAVIGVRVAGPAIEDYPTPVPAAAMKRLDLAALGLDAAVLAHRALAPRASQDPRKSIEQLADLLAVHVAPEPVPTAVPVARPRRKTLDDTDPVRRTDPEGRAISDGPPPRVLVGDARTHAADATRTTDPDGFVRRPPTGDPLPRNRDHARAPTPTPTPTPDTESPRPRAPTKPGDR